MKPEYPEKTTDLSQIPDKLYPIMLYQVHFLVMINCNLVVYYNSKKIQVKQGNSLIETASVGAEPPPYQDRLASYAFWLILRMSLVERELLILPKLLSSPSGFSGVRITRSLVLCVCFVDRCLSFCNFSFSHCVVCFSSIYGFCLPLWYFQSLLQVRA